MPTRFRNRREAGQELASMLADYAGQDDLLVLALPRGGVPVAYEVATALGAPLEVFVVRKLGVPGHEELAMGAIASGGLVVISDALINELDIPEAAVSDAIQRELRELARRDAAYRGDRPFPQIAERTVILVDDGLATGSTMRAAVAAVRQQNPRRIVIAVPTASPVVCSEFRGMADDVVCAMTPEPFYAVGLWYEDFSPTSDAEVQQLLAQARQQDAPATDEQGEQASAE